MEVHQHPLKLIDLQLEYPYNEEEYDEEEDDENEDLITKHDFRCSCDRCRQEITQFHGYYYKCSDSCGYSIHKFCAELPATLDHASHRAHTLFLRQMAFEWPCDICQSDHEPEELAYYCVECHFFVDVNCATKGVHIIRHPSHPHPLKHISRQILCKCDACGKEHKGIFYQCTTCFDFFIHKDCALLPKKLLIQNTTNDSFSHTHPLTLTYSFPKADQIAKFLPCCRVCGDFFLFSASLWIYKCEKFRFYTHLDCATSREEPFMSIFLSAGLGKTLKNFEDADHPDLLHLPFPNHTYSLLKHLFFKEIGSGTFDTDEGNLIHMSHQHPLSLVGTQFNDITRPTTSRIRTLSYHNPMKKIELLCNGCLRPITTGPFYKCANEDQHCNFVLHEWCTRLPTKVPDHPGHPQHTLIFLPNAPRKFFSVFYCAICGLPCNGFVYCCVECEYYIDVSCGFIPEKITHEAHPNHLLSRVQKRFHEHYCRICLVDFSKYRFSEDRFSFSCGTCDFYLHVECALLLLQTIRHKYDKHPMTLSYFPIENHKADYFCEICEEEFDPKRCFHHCHECVRSMHSACAPLILQSETHVYSKYWRGVYEFVNIKFEGIHKIEDHPHPLSFVQGIESDGRCMMCRQRLQYEMIFKCLQCKYSICYACCKRLSN